MVPLVQSDRGVFDWYTKGDQFGMLNTNAVNWCYYDIPIKFPKPWSIDGLQLELIPGGFELHGDDGELWGRQKYQPCLPYPVEDDCLYRHYCIGPRPDTHSRGQHQQVGRPNNFKISSLSILQSIL